MKAIIQTILFLFILVNTLGNQARINEILLQNEFEVPTYLPSSTGLNQLFLNMEFGGSKILNPEEISTIKNASILQADIVFSNFPMV